MVFEDAVDPELNDRTGGSPGHPPRLVAQFASGGMSFRAVYNLPGRYSGLGKPGYINGLHVHLEGTQHYSDAFPGIDIHNAADLGRALAQVDAVRQRVKDDQPVDYFLGVAVPVRIEKWILAGIAAIIVIVLMVALA